MQKQWLRTKSKSRSINFSRYAKNTRGELSTYRLVELVEYFVALFRVICPANAVYSNEKHRQTIATLCSTVPDELCD